MAEETKSTANHLIKSSNWSTATLRKTKTQPIKAGFAKTVKEFTQNSSVHGIGYIFSRETPSVDACFWALVSVASLSLAVFMSVDAYLDWQEKPTITTMASSNLPSSEVTFPAVTICRDGVDMKAVEDAIFNDFIKWKQQTGHSSKSKKEDEDLLHQYMAETYKVSGKRNIFDLVKAHLSPDPSEGNVNDAIIENLKVCNKKDSKSEVRKKRDTEKDVERIGKRTKRDATEELLKKVTHLLSDMGNQYYRVEASPSDTISSSSSAWINSTCQAVGLVPLCTDSSSELCSVLKDETMLADKICGNTTTQTCSKLTNTFLLSNSSPVCLAKDLSTCDSQTTHVLCGSPTGKFSQCHIVCSVFCGVEVNGFLQRFCSALEKTST